MIVEDDPVASIVLERFIGKLGYEVFDICKSGECAIKAIEHKCPDLVLMDMLLLGTLTGSETAMLIEKKCDIDIIFISAYDEKFVQEVRNEKWFKGVIPKPFNHTLLAKMIDKAMERVL